MTLIPELDPLAPVTFRWYWHAQRRRHVEAMAYALAKIEFSEENVRQSNHFATKAKENPEQVKWKVLSNSHAHMGWEDVLEAIATLTGCGCPSVLWPEKVRKAVREHE